MLTKIFATTVLLVVSWQTVFNTYIRQDVRSLEISVEQIQAMVQRDISNIDHATQTATKKINDNLENYVSLQEQNLSASKKLAGTSKKIEQESKTLKAKLKAKDGEIKHLGNVAELNRAYADVLQAEVFSLRKNGETAAKILLSTKGAIYKAGAHFPQHKTKLRKLMGPIDALAGRWKRGDYSKSSLEIRQALKAIISNGTT